MTFSLTFPPICPQFKVHGHHMLLYPLNQCTYPAALCTPSQLDSKQQNCEWDFALKFFQSSHFAQLSQLDILPKIPSESPLPGKNHVISDQWTAFWSMFFVLWRFISVKLNGPTGICSKPGKSYLILRTCRGCPQTQHGQDMDRLAVWTGTTL